MGEVGAICENSVYVGFVLENTPLEEKFPGLERHHGKRSLPSRTMVNYSIGDFLIKIKNASMARNKEIVVSSNKQIEAIAMALKKLGYLDSVTKEKNSLKLALTFKNKRPLLTDLKLVSKPGLRIYMGITEIEKKRGPSTYLISTPIGIISTREAVKARVGGEVIAEIS